MNFLSEQPVELSRRAHYEDESRKNNGTEFARSIKGEPQQPNNLFSGSTATTFLQHFLTEQECSWKNIWQMLVWDNRMKVWIHRKHEKFRDHRADLATRYVQIR